MKKKINIEIEIDKLTFLDVILRIVVFPFMAIVTLIGVLGLWVKILINFIKYGGETIAYTDQTKKTTIHDVFNKIDETLNN